MTANKLVLFDLDGTLVKAGGSGRLALNTAIAELYGAKNICSRISVMGKTDVENFTSAARLASGKKPCAEVFRQVEQRYLKHLPGEVRQAVKGGRYELIKGIKGFLSALENAGVPYGLGTGNVKAGAYIKLEPSGLSEKFVFGGFGGDGMHRAQVLRAAVKRAEKHLKTSFKPSQVYIIGDTENDVFAAVENGYHSAVVTSGFGDEKTLLKAGPELMESDYSDLYPWLLWLGVKQDPKGVERGSYICPDTPIDHVFYSRTGIDAMSLRVGIKSLRKKKKADAKLAR
ncbi:MAG: HAD hydrolase-like protein [Elusimicrobia bacterium]|nr:HAD hydrolase-like protein [Elusimicrobiota bacterium]